MKLLIKLAVLFGIFFSILLIHYATYDRTQKVEDIAMISSHVKYPEPSFSFQSIEYKRFVYAK